MRVMGHIECRVPRSEIMIKKKWSSEIFLRLWKKEDIMVFQCHDKIMSLEKEERKMLDNMNRIITMTIKWWRKKINKEIHAVTNLKQVY